MKVQALDSRDPLDDVERIGADEQVREAVEAVHGVARSDADQALVGVDEHQRRIEVPARHRIPRRVKGRVHVQP